MSRKKYSTELKLEIVQRYLKGGISIKTLSEQYAVWMGDIQKWRDAYLEHGVNGLCTTHGTYTGDFKLSVINYMHTTGASIRKTAAHFNIPSYKSVSDWKKLYDELGVDALYIEHRGRASKMGKKRPRNNKPVHETNEDLLAEVQRLRMENEYLKKLNALIQEKEKAEQQKK